MIREGGIFQAQKLAINGHLEVCHYLVLSAPRESPAGVVLVIYSLDTRNGEYMDTWISPRIPRAKPGKKLKLRFSRVGKRSEPYGLE